MLSGLLWGSVSLQAVAVTKYRPSIQTLVVLVAFESLPCNSWRLQRDSFKTPADLTHPQVSAGASHRPWSCGLPPRKSTT